MTNPTTTKAPTPDLVVHRCRQALVEDLFCATFSYAATEGTLRSMAGWLMTMNIFMDSTIREMWANHPVGHSPKGVKAIHDWDLLNQAAAAIGDPVVSPPEAWEG